MQIDLIGLDADDTLWHNEIHYRRGRDIFDTVLGKYGIHETDDSRLHELEIGNLEYFGYGAVGFAMSMAEAAVELTLGAISSRDLLRLLSVSKEILSADVELFKGVERVVASLARTYPLMLITKGDQRHQASKLERSGLRPAFNHVEIVSEKSAQSYREILEKVDVRPDRFIMVGNAMKSDVLPVLEIGGHAVYIHNDLTWAFEQAEPSELASDHFHELDTISDLPALIQRLGA